MKKTFLFPPCLTIVGEDLCVIHPPIANESLTPTTDLGLKPNGLTLDDLQANHEFVHVGDDLDKAAVAAKISSSLSKETKSTISALQKLAKGVSKQLNHV